jgi:aryl-alcohol dehydrogenase-like predicted oxidoreductase
MSRLPHRALGPYSVSAVSIGCMNLDHAYGDHVSEDDGARLLNRALDLGCTMLDTATIYGAGESERRLNRAVMHRRSEFTLASKCVLGVRDGQRFVDGRPATILEMVDSSLERLGTDHIDLYYMHRPDPKVAIEDSIGALVRAKEAGKIGAIGLSEMNAGTVRRAHAVHPIAALQTEYSPWVRNPEIAVLETCRELGIAFVAFSPVGRGYFGDWIKSATYRDGDIRALMPRFLEPNFSRNLALLDPFREIAKGLGISCAQLAIAWTLERAPHIIALPGTVNEAHLAEDLEAAKLVLPEQAVTAIDAIFTPDAVSGTRYPPSLQATVSTEMFEDEQAQLATAD